MKASEYNEAVRGAEVVTGMDDPLIRALIQKMPPYNMEWPVDIRRRWLKCFAAVMNLIYEDVGDIEVTAIANQPPEDFEL